MSGVRLKIQFFSVSWKINFLSKKWSKKQTHKILSEISEKASAHQSDDIWWWCMIGCRLIVNTILLIVCLISPRISRPINSSTTTATPATTTINGEADDEASTLNQTEPIKEKLIDPSIFISLRQNDWRDAHEGRMIIWSHESQHHPDYGKTLMGGGKKQKMSHRHSMSSQFMSFCILGSVIGFILYTYFSHVIMMRRLSREREASRLRELVHRSALIMAGSAQHSNIEFSERRRSLINMFQSFKL